MSSKHSDRLQALLTRLRGNIDTDEERTLLQSIQTAQRLEKGEGFSVVPVVSERDGSPKIDASWMGMLAQLEPGQAREVAIALLDCAAQAETDAVAMRLFREDMNLDEQTARVARQRLRHLRDELQAQPVRALIQEPSISDIQSLGRKPS